MPSTDGKWVLFDAGLLIGALLKGDPRHEEARSVVESARRGDITACVTAGILSELYAALTWSGSQPQHSPDEAAHAVRLLCEPASAIRVIEESRQVALDAVALAAAHGLTARRIHDARHAAAALCAGVTHVYTYDVQDWRMFEADGIHIAGPESTLALLGRSNK